MSDISSDPADVRITVKHQCGDCGLIGPIDAAGHIIGEHAPDCPARDISSVTGSGWDGWPERSDARDAFDRRVEAVSHQVRIEKPKWSGSMVQTDAIRRVLEEIKREAVEPWRKVLADTYEALLANDCREDNEERLSALDGARALLEGNTDEEKS